MTFEDEEVNIGDGMNITSGIFTAPISGVYWLSFVFRSRYDGDFTNASHIRFMRNEDIIMTGTALHRSVGNLASAAQLAAGDEVYLVLGDQWDAALFSDHGRQTVFSGFLLAPTF